MIFNKVLSVHLLMNRLLNASLSVCLFLLFSQFGMASGFDTESTRKFPFEKVFIVVLENEGADQSLSQPFLGELAKKGAYFNEFYAVTHPSQPNYIAMTAGDTFSIFHDGNVTLDVRNILDLLEEKGKTWKVYADGFPGGCYLGSSTGKYVRKHVPFLSFKNVQTRPERCARIVDGTELIRDILVDEIADFSFYVPDMDHDGHDTGVRYADDWLKQTFGPLLENPNFMKGMLFIVTFDEAGWFNSNRIYTAFYGDSVIPGKISNESYDFYSLLRTIEEGLGLGSLNRKDARATPMTGIWR